MTSALMLEGNMIHENKNESKAICFTFEPLGYGHQLLDSTTSLASSQGHNSELVVFLSIQFH